MASRRPKTEKQLGQFLQEQQEPFILEIYLSERGYRKKNLHSEGSINSCKGNSSKSLNRSLSFSRSCSFSLNNSKKGIPICPKVLRAVYRKLISVKHSPKLKKNDNKIGQYNVTEVARNIQDVEPDRFSSARSTKVFNSCSESDVGEATTQMQKDDISFKADASQFFKLCTRVKETAADRKLGRKCMEEDEERISPVSVLEEVHPHRVSPLARQDSSSTTQEGNSSKSSTTLAKKITEDSLLSAILWSLLFESAKKKSSNADAAELEEPIRSKPSYSQLLKSKRNLQQTRQLLFDCVREALDIHGKERKQQQNHEEFVSPELLGKLLCDKIKVSGKQSGDEFDITILLNLDFQDSAQEWTNFQPQMKELAFEIGDVILEEIRDQIVIDMVYLSKNLITDY